MKEYNAILIIERQNVKWSHYKQFKRQALDRQIYKERFICPYYTINNAMCVNFSLCLLALDAVFNCIFVQYTFSFLVYFKSSYYHHLFKWEVFIVVFVCLFVAFNVWRLCCYVSIAHHGWTSSSGGSCTPIPSLYFSSSLSLYLYIISSDTKIVSLAFFYTLHTWCIFMICLFESGSHYTTQAAFHCLWLPTVGIIYRYF